MEILYSQNETQSFLMVQDVSKYEAEIKLPVENERKY